MADVLIAGGGIAGSALAMMLGRCGLTVELFERGLFPREKPCGEGVMPPGVALLGRWGLGEAVGGAPFHGVRYRVRGRSVSARFPSVRGKPAYGLGQRRRVLDEALFRAAGATPGVTAHCDSLVDAPIVENGRVVGLRVAGKARRGRLVVAADGVHSRLRHQLGLHLPPGPKRLGLRAHFRLAPGQQEVPWVEIFGQRDRELYVTPLPNRELQVAVLVEAESFALANRSAHRAFESWCRSEPALVARLEGAEQISELAGMSPLSGRARSGVYPGMVLLGDAAGFLDPLTGGGISQALLSAELLAGYLAPAVTGSAAANRATVGWRNSPPDDGWLWAFERDRRTMLRDYRRMTQAMLWLSRHRTLAGAVLWSAGRSSALFSHLLGVSSGMRPLFGKEFATPLANPGKIMAPMQAEEATRESRHAIL